LKAINVVFENSEYAELYKGKGEQTWREYILRIAGIKKQEGE
jgi:hypothetical protein